MVLRRQLERPNTKLLIVEKDFANNPKD